MSNGEYITFSKPDFDSIQSNGYTAVDMHVHSRYSDSFAKVRSLLKRASRLGIGFSIVDHNEVTGSLKAIENAESVLVVPGIEITSVEGVHLLAYFYEAQDLADFFYRRIKEKRSKNPYMFTRLSAEKILDYLEEYSCLSAAAHPCILTVIGLCTAVRSGTVSESELNRIDAIEAICGSQTRKSNRKAISIGNNLGKNFTGGSDAHTLQALGNVVTYSQSTTVSEFLDSIRKNRNNVIGKLTAPNQYASGCVQSVIKHMRYFGPSVGLRYHTMIKRPIAIHGLRIKNGLANIKKRIHKNRRHKQVIELNNKKYQKQ